MGPAVRSSRPGFSLTALRASTSGSVFVEFVFIAPVLATLLVGSNEMTRLMRARQHLEDYATTVANDVAAANEVIPAATLRDMIERIGLVAPELIDPAQSAWDNTVRTQGAATITNRYLLVGISMVVSTPIDSSCHVNCTYTTKLAWTFGNYQRKCNNAVTLPTGSVQEGPVVIVDVTTDYKFVFGPAAHLGTGPTLSATTFQPLKNSKFAGVAPTVSPARSGGWNGTTCP